MSKNRREPKHQKTSPKPTTPKPPTQKTNPEPLTDLLQRAEMAPHSLTPAEAQRLQRTIGNQAIGRLGPNASPAVDKTSPQASLQRMLDANQGRETADSVSSLPGSSQAPTIQRYLMNKSVYPYVVLGPSDLDEAQQNRIINTLIFKGDLDGYVDIEAQVKFSKKAVKNVNMAAQQGDKDNIYIYDADSLGKPELQATYEISDIGNEYNVGKACVLQALIAADAETTFTTAQELHENLWETRSPYRLYDLDDVYPLLYAAKGLTRHDADNERLDTLVEETLEVGKKYVLVAPGLIGGNGHNFCIRVKTVGSGNLIHKDYDLIEDPNNQGGVLDDTRIAEYWST